MSRLAVAESSGDPPKRYERAAGQAAGPISNRTIRRSAASKPSGSTPGPSQSIHTPKRRERAVGEYARPVSTEPPAEALRASRRAVRWARLDRTIRRSLTSEPLGKPLGPSRSIRRSDVCKLCGTPPDMRQPTTVATRCTSTPPSARASGRFHYRTEPLRLFAVNPLTVGELGRRVIGEVILV